MAETKTEGQKLAEKLLVNKNNGWEGLSEVEKKKIMKFSDGYIDFLNNGKIEREIIKESEKIAKANGFKPLSSFKKLKAGDKVYSINRGKNIILAVIGKDKLEDGINVVGAHTDSPRLDLKPNPLYEDTDFAYLKTQYYGGIKKYQWVTIPLAIHGVVALKNGKTIDVKIGDEADDLTFVITDLLPHMGRHQMEKKASEVIEGENLTLLIGSMPVSDDKVKEKVKLNTMKILNEKYGIVEEDFLSAELEIVPAFNAKSMGFDRSMVAGYGQDDKVCSYCSLMAICETEAPKKTAVCLLVDKEEIGSVGNTGMESLAFETFLGEIIELCGESKTPNILHRLYQHSAMLSADVDGAFDPLYASVADKKNASFFGYGVGMNKYTGGRGKGGANDANAEFVAKIRKLFDDNKVRFQIAELGKVDEGGGGTIAYILANKGMDVIDCGTPVLSMHSPYETTSKFDVYHSYLAYKAFMNKYM
ncbi:MAG: aminopeptidase [Clostridia bacterium]|nr:aminopeptidase [Clostridia bacterium]